MKTRSWVLLTLLSLLFAGCATSGPSLNTTYQHAPSLEIWMEQEAVPYLIHELGENPMFKNQPFLLVSLDRDNVDPQIDELTLMIRERIIDGLLTRPGINLAWRPSSTPPQHHRSLSQVNCGDMKQIRYYIGIDAGISPVDNNLHVKIRALNILENNWVSGFGISWRGNPTAGEKRAVMNRRPDDFLLGLRPLPFNEKQADLLAAYLSQNLSCLFARMELSELIVHVKQDAPKRIEFFNNALGLVKNYLAKYREIQVTEDPNQANILVQSTVHDIHTGLYQVWITARTKHAKTYVPGMETEAYVRIAPEAADPAPIRPAAVKQGVAPKTVTEPKPKPLVPGGRAYDLCFYEFLDGFEQEIYPVLQTYPGVTQIKRRYERCTDTPQCLCYELTVAGASAGRMETLTRWLDYRLPKSRSLGYRMRPLSDTSLEIVFHRGFD